MSKYTKKDAYHRIGNAIALLKDELWKGWETQEELDERRAIFDELCLMRDKFWRASRGANVRIELRGGKGGW